MPLRFPEISTFREHTHPFNLDQIVQYLTSYLGFFWVWTSKKISTTMNFSVNATGIFFSDLPYETHFFQVTTLKKTRLVRHYFLICGVSNKPCFLKSISRVQIKRGFKLLGLLSSETQIETQPRVFFYWPNFPGELNIWRDGLHNEVKNVFEV